MTEEIYETGYIKLFRSLLDEEFLSDPEYISIWIYCLLNANFKPKIHKGTPIKRGQFKTGRKSISENLGISESKVERILSYFEEKKHIEQQKTNKYRLITICYYDKYQKSEQQATTGNNRQQQATTENTTKKDKKDKNVNKDKKEYTDDFLIFWEEYPEKKAKQIAFTSFLKAIKITDLNTMLKAIKIYKQNKPKDIRFKYPATWLNGSCWEDEYAKQPKEKEFETWL